MTVESRLWLVSSSRIWPWTDGPTLLVSSRVKNAVTLRLPVISRWQLCFDPLLHDHGSVCRPSHKNCHEVDIPNPSLESEQEFDGLV